MNGWSYKARLVARHAVIRNLLAEGLTTNQLVSRCRMLPPFEVCTNRRDGRVRLLSRNRIRTLIREVQGKLVTGLPDGRREMAVAYDRLLLAFRTALANEDAGAMVRAQRAINHMLGIDKGAHNLPIDASAVLAQLEKMDATIGDNGHDNGN